ncbi:CaiB/BaiF CoA transferase family protein [Parapedomonas caeni]
MGTLTGYRILEIAGIGPGPFASMMLADQGADVIRIDRLGGKAAGVATDQTRDILGRSRRSIAVDLKSPEGVALVLDLVAQADALVEGFRPGVMERLGLGPDVCLKRNPRLVYGRMTGWGQEGPMAPAAGHDINYIALAGALAHYGRAGEKPTPPINMVGDFGGGGMLMAFGVVCALLEAQKSGQGQVIDAAMVDGAALLMSMIWTFKAMGIWSEKRGVNLLDTGTHFYDTYETSDGRFISLGAIEPQFYAEFRARAGLAEDKDFDAQMNPASWGPLKAKLTDLFKQKTCDEWCAILEGSDACFAPVLTMSEAARHPHNVQRGTFVEVSGITQPAPAPRFSRTPAGTPRPPVAPGAHTDAVLADFGFSADKIATLRQAKVVG